MAKRTPLRAVDDLLEPAVSMQIKALQCGDADAGFVQAALVLARTIDGMDDDMRQRMLPNTVGALLKTLETRARRPIAARPSRLHALRRPASPGSPKPGSAMWNGTLRHGSRLTG